ncbi:MAG TPA: ABC transporter ATP-binding protein [Elusimicrobiales bacterium]|nr:ABC transporter ATP-binding protein [Elusimicrobiales bacterium]
MNDIVEVRDLSKVYTQGHEQVLVLENVNFEIRAGEFTAMLGPSGSGKSTFLNLIGLLDDCYSGSITLFGSKLESMGEAEKAELRRRRIGFVFQFDSLLPEFTVLENVDMPARIAGRGDPAAALALLKRFGLEAIARKFPMDISGGEKQRAAILRALRNRPALVIADEPTGNLDRHNAVTVLEDLKKVNAAGAAVLMVTHNEEAAAYADRVFHLSGGRLVETRGRR